MRMVCARSISGVADALCYGVLVGIALLMMASKADARPTVDQSVSASSRQWLLVDQMTGTTMLAVLGINTIRGVDAIERSRLLFGRTLHGLRSGDAELGLAPATTPEVLNSIARIEAVWPHYDAVLQTIVTELRTAPEVQESHIEELTDIHTLMIDAIDDTTDAFRSLLPRTTTARR